MKLIILALTLFVMPLLSKSQGFKGGVIAGINAAQIDGDTQGGYKKIGFIAGAFVDYKISKKSFIEANFYYIGKGAVKNVEYAGGIVWQEFKTTLHYIEMPISYSYRVMRQFSLAAGLAPAYLFADRLVSIGTIISKSTYQLSNFDFGISGQVEFYFPKNFSIELRVTRSLISIRRDHFWLNNSLSFVGKYRF